MFVRGPPPNDSLPNLFPATTAADEYTEAELPLELLFAGEDCSEGLAASALEEDFNRGKVLLPLTSSTGVSGML